MTTKERLKQISPLVRVVRYSREKRLAARHSLQDARFLAGRTRRSKRVEAYLSRHTSPKLQLGTGSNVYDGWLNTDVVDYKRGNEVLYLDVRKRFPLPDNSFDAVFSEHVIEHVTYRDGLHCLRECRRVLKPGGRLLFVEHGLAPEPAVIRWQHRLTPCWRRIGGGCHLDRKMDDLIRNAGFRVDALETGYMKGPKPWTFMYVGSATS